jgi:hypothetical protein
MPGWARSTPDHRAPITAIGRERHHGPGAPVAPCSSRPMTNATGWLGSKSWRLRTRTCILDPRSLRSRRRTGPCCQAAPPGPVWGESAGPDSRPADGRERGAGPTRPTRQRPGRARPPGMASDVRGILRQNGRRLPVRLQPSPLALRRKRSPLRRMTAIISAEDAENRRVHPRKHETGPRPGARRRTDDGRPRRGRTATPERPGLTIGAPGATIGGEPGLQRAGAGLRSVSCFRTFVFS